MVIFKGLFLYFSIIFIGVHCKNLVAILHLLVALARKFRAPIRLPDNVAVQVVVVQVSTSHNHQSQGQKNVHELTH